MKPATKFEKETKNNKTYSCFYILLVRGLIATKDSRDLKNSGLILLYTMDPMDTIDITHGLFGDSIENLQKLFT